MPKDNVIELKKPERFVDDPMIEGMRKGAGKLLAKALEKDLSHDPLFIEGFSLAPKGNAQLPHPLS